MNTPVMSNTPRTGTELFRTPLREGGIYSENEHDSMKATFQSLFTPKLVTPALYTPSFMKNRGFDEELAMESSDLHVVPSTNDLGRWERMEVEVGQPRAEMSVPQFSPLKEPERIGKQMEEAEKSMKGDPSLAKDEPTAIPKESEIDKEDNVEFQQKKDATKLAFQRLHRKKIREAAIIRFRQKKEERKFGIKHVRYECRKKIADSRPRVKGRFVRKGYPVAGDDMEDNALRYLNVNAMK